ncbi:MAE_28990/MAE_18760 family HEPN-like nuclease [Stutzerimonas stutzeri]|uniref:MAE_28990/MAE_18760 family HEPN-like nuclease n=1 Tax=Stutzerimonas stutzeri TaxID=316 RepID=UPI0021093C5A|nr:MAE_28990/MAE_18760 family HEPN-like nuclease [Stutzerimonas stutzeri]MCQ4241407.1 hypothetical protein [Stutzerimonas stutzeri]
MRGVIADLKDREYSINRLLEHVEEISEMRGRVDITVVLKSSVFIAIYNNIEATAYAAVERIHESASHLRYEELADPFKIKMLKYSFGKLSAAHMTDPQKTHAEENKIKLSQLTFPNLTDYLRRQSLFSGNIDARKLNVTGISYGLPKLTFPKADAERMLWVKNKRNKIAHGEQSMSDGGQGIKTADLRCAFASVSRTLRHFISEVEVLLCTEAFKANQRT